MHPRRPCRGLSRGPGSPGVKVGCWGSPVSPRNKLPWNRCCVRPWAGTSLRTVRPQQKQQLGPRLQELESGLLPVAGLWGPSSLPAAGSLTEVSGSWRRQKGCRWKTGAGCSPGHTHTECVGDLHTLKGTNTSPSANHVHQRESPNFCGLGVLAWEPFCHADLVTHSQLLSRGDSLSSGQETCLQGGVGWRIEEKEEKWRKGEKGRARMYERESWELLVHIQASILCSAWSRE